MKCSNFCPPNCKGKHHPVLLSLMRVNSKETLQKFKERLQAYQLMGFQISMNVPDPNPTFRYPLLHWAAVLGKVNVITMLLQSPFNVNSTVKSDKGESVLHRLLLFWNFQTNVKDISQMIKILKECIPCTDSEEKSPLHICAEFLTSCSRKELTFWKTVFKLMTEHLTDDLLRKKVLNSTDANKEAIIHILSKREELLDIVEYIMCAGADDKIVNGNNETSLEIAWRYALPIYNYLQMFATQSKLLNIHAKAGKRRLRTVSETIGYTHFFENNDSSEDQLNEEPKQKVSKSNNLLSQKIETLSLNSPLKKKKMFCKKRQKRRCVGSTDSGSEKKANIGTTYLQTREYAAFTAELKSHGVYLDIQVGCKKDKLLGDINHRISAIRDMCRTRSEEDLLESISSHHNDSDDTAYDADEESFNLNERIEVIQECLERVVR